MKRVVAVFCFLMLWVCAAAPAPAALVRDMNLQALCDRAGCIFVGTCTGVETVARDANGTSALHYTFAPARILKGRAREEIVVRVHRLAAESAGAPRFSAGDRVVLFLYPESDLGYSAPVGFGQGRFRIVTGSDGVPAVVNDRDNRGLFRGMDAAALGGRLRVAAEVTEVLQRTQGACNYDLFIEIVEALLR